MTKINFDEDGRSYIEIKSAGDKISVVLSAEDAENSLNTIVNSVSITREQFLSLIKDIIKN